jgi:hypothetical protein
VSPTSSNGQELTTTAVSLGLHSITSPACSSSVGGTWIPSVFAVAGYHEFKLSCSLNGQVRRLLSFEDPSTYVAARRFQVQGSVSKAALHLRLAQPSLSRHELGLKHFDRRAPPARVASSILTRTPIAASSGLCSFELFAKKYRPCNGSYAPPQFGALKAARGNCLERPCRRVYGSSLVTF